MDNAYLGSAADQIIEKFGGIRPMAAKLQVPVTTVQGWKKRNLIPANRIDLIRECAALHGIDLGGVARVQIGGDAPTVSAAPANEGHMMARPFVVSRTPEGTAPMPEPVCAPAPLPSKQKSSNGVWLATTLLAIAILVGLLAMFPGVQRLVAQQDRITRLEQNIGVLTTKLNALESQNALLRGLIPKDVQGDIVALQQKSNAMSALVTGLSTQTQALTQSVLGDTPDTMETRLSKLESNTAAPKASAASSAPISSPLMTLLSNIRAAQKTPAGQKMLAQAGTDLGAVTSVDQLKPGGEAFKLLTDLPKEDWKLGAALIVALPLQAQLAGDVQPVDGGLEILPKFLSGLTGDEWKHAAKILTPVVRTGVPRLKRLQDELAAGSPAWIAAAAQDQNASWVDRALSRLSGVIRIERDGVLMFGSDTERAVQAATRALAVGDVASARAALAPIASAHGFVTRLDQVMAAQAVQNHIARVIGAELALKDVSGAFTRAYQGGPDRAALREGLVRSLSTP